MLRNFFYQNILVKKREHIFKTIELNVYFLKSPQTRNVNYPAGQVIQGPEEAFILKVMGVREKGSQARKE